MAEIEPNEPGWATRPPLLARLCARAGPARALVVEAGGVQVAAVPGRYSVSYVIAGPDGAAVVDVGSRRDHALVLAALAGLGRTPADVRFVLPSHLHFDHVMGLDALAQRLDVPVLLGETAWRHVRAARPTPFPGPLRSLRAAVTWPMQGLPFFAAEDLPAGFGFGFPWSENRFRAALAGPIADGDSVPGLAGWRLLAAPGHAADAVALYHEEARFLVPGDTIRNFYGGEWSPLLVDGEAFAATRRRLGALPVDVIFPGHGPVLRGPDPLARVRVLPPGTP